MQHVSRLKRPDLDTTTQVYKQVPNIPFFNLSLIPVRAKARPWHTRQGRQMK